MRLPLLLACFALAACTTRPLTPAEVALVGSIHGETLETGDLKITRARALSAFPISFDARPRVTCREKIGPPRTGRIETKTAGFVLFERFFVNPIFALQDYAATYDPSYREGPYLDLAAAMFFAHEMTHVWQWQNRDVTGYNPLKAFREQVVLDDPYLFDPETPQRFLDQGYEVQASLVEEYLCCATLDPGGERTLRLRDTLREVFPVAEPEEFARPVIVPFKRDLKDVCS